MTGELLWFLPNHSPSIHADDSSINKLEKLSCGGKTGGCVRHHLLRLGMLKGNIKVLNSGIVK